MQNSRIVLSLLATLALSCHSSLGYAATQQEKMKNCHAEAKQKNLKGDERRQFMSQCLRGKADGPSDKLKACRKEAKAKSLKGDDRQKFLADCSKE